jgi:hypothetical protein
MRWLAKAGSFKVLIRIPMERSVVPRAAGSQGQAVNGDTLAGEIGGTKGEGLRH